MEMLTEESSSDVEILEPQILKDRYHRHELRLIIALSKCGEYQIPKKWEDFQVFVKNVLKFYLSPHLVRSVWVQLHACYQLANGASSCSLVEIVDEEEGKEVVKQRNNEFFTNVGGIIHTDLYPGIKGEKSSNEQSSDYIEINDEEEVQVVVEQQNEHFINTAGVIHEGLKPNEGEKSSNEQPCDYIEINDEEDGREVLKQHKFLSNVGGIIHKELNAGKGEESSNEQLCDYIEINDEEEVQVVVKQQNDNFINTVEVIHEGLIPGNNRKISGSQQSSDYLEITAEEDIQIVEQHDKHFIHIGKVIHEKLKQDKTGKFNNEQQCDYFEISDEEEVEQVAKQHRHFITVHEELKPAIEEKKSSHEASSDYIEISDEEGAKEVKHLEQCRNIKEVIQEELKPDIKEEKSCNTSDYLKISDEEENKQQNHTEPYDTPKKSDYIPKQTLKQRFSMPNGRKRNRNGVRRSLPNSVEEAEAEALREKLLLDKIIELELPQVIKGFLNKSNIVKSATKRRKKSSVDNRKSINGTSSDGSFSASEIV